LEDEIIKEVVVAFIMTGNIACMNLQEVL